MDYRLFYQEKTGKFVPETFDIHHIDEDRSNNEIENLVAIPRDLHRDFHKAKPPEGILLDFRPKSILTPGREALGAYLLVMRKFYPYYSEVCHWIDYRDFLLGKIPNVHHFSYNK